MPKHGQKSMAFLKRARKVIPHGVNSNFRYNGDATPVVAHAKGAYVYDFDGKRYIDYRLGYGPIILGHAHPYVNQRVQQAIEGGVTFAATQEYEVRVAERIVEMCPGVEMVRLSNSGSEATMHAIRLARAYTGRDKILKFEGCYHGGHDHVLWSTASGKLEETGDRHHPRAYKQSLGIPEILRNLIEVAPWNDIEILGDILEEKGEEIAAIILEPILGNGAALMPQLAFLQFLREQCDRYGIVLIFDEVKTGFRIAPGGAGEYFGVLPDLSTFAKALGNGYPIAAIGGKQEIMMHIGPGKVFHGGTYAGNVVATAAADATLELMQAGKVFPQIEKTGSMLMQGIEEILSRYGIPHRLHGTPGMFGITFMEENPLDWRDLHKADWELYEDIVAVMRERGVMPTSDGFEPFFLSAAHTEADVAETLEAFEAGVKQVLVKQN
ncbi:MAG: aminotransferase class III-fold pyridoxal phosphate-dependent enzyme [Chloroflexi bacterium]|nr:MAG: aminotransferase class III-fold pyridoxal phosphate-dependent enzyme [Chloroflexota bacterium]